MDSQNQYSVLKTIFKGAPPLIIIILVQAACAAANAAGITVDSAFVMKIAMGGYGAYLALMNWIKNRKK